MDQSDEDEEIWGTQSNKSRKPKEVQFG